MRSHINLKTVNSAAWAETILDRPNLCPPAMLKLADETAHPKKKQLTFGDFVVGVYRTWGQQRAKGIVQLAIKAHVIEFRGTERLVIS
jgi:hypothetical protein